MTGAVSAGTAVDTSRVNGCLAGDRVEELGDGLGVAGDGVLVANGRGRRCIPLGLDDLQYARGPEPPVVGSPRLLTEEAEFDEPSDSIVGGWIGNAVDLGCG